MPSFDHRPAATRPPPGLGLLLTCCLLSAAPPLHAEPPAQAPAAQPAAAPAAQGAGLQSPDPGTRIQAAHALALKGDLAAYPALIAALSGASEASEQQALLQALEKLPYDIPTLVGHLQGMVDPIGRSYAAYTLGRMRATEAVPALLLALKDPEATVRERAISALGAIGDPRAFEGLIKAAHRDPSPALRRKAEEEATRLGAGGNSYVDEETLIARLGSPDPLERREAAQTLGRQGSWWAVGPLVQALGDPHPEVRERAIASLGELGDSRASAGLTAHLKGAQGMERYLTLASISIIGDIGARETIEPYLRSEDVHSRRAAARALGTLAQGDAAPALAAAFSVEPLPVIKQEYVQALGRIADPRGVPTLVKAAQPKEAEEVRYGAIRALGGIPAPEALAALADLLEDKEPLIRAQAMDALAPREDAARSPAIIQTLERHAREDTDPYAQQAALEAATALRGKSRLLEQGASPPVPAQPAPAAP